MKLSNKSQSRMAALDLRIVFGVIILAGCVFLANAFLGGGSGSGSETSFHLVESGDFMVSVVEGGEVNAVKETVLRCEIDGTARIIYIIPEGSQVKKGDLLVELDAADLIDSINAEQIKFEQSQASYTQSAATLEITQSTLMTSLRNASNTLHFAKLDLEKYTDGDYQQTLLTSSNDIVSFEQSLKVSKDKMENTKKLFDKGFETLNNLESSQLSYTNQLFSLMQAKENLRLFELYEHPKSLTTFNSAVADAADDLERARLEGEGNMAKARADLSAQLSTLLLNSNKLDRLKTQLNKSKIYAPQDGLVIYAVSSSRYSSESLIEEGATIRNRQEIIKLPDVSRLKVNLKISESNIGQVKEGLVAYVIFDTKPDEKFKAYVSKVSIVPEASSRWGGSNTKVYPTTVLLDTLIDGVKPGVSAQVEIITTNLVDVITIPTQCVTTQKEQTVVFKKSGADSKPVEVELGAFDDKRIQILSGVEAGDRVSMSPPLNYDADDLDGSVVREGEKVDTKPKDPKELKTSDDSEEKTQRPQGEAGGGGDMRARIQEMMKKYDKDGDGKLNDEERKAAQAEFSKMRGGGSGQGRPGGGGGGNRQGGGNGGPK